MIRRENTSPAPDKLKRWLEKEGVSYRDFSLMVDVCKAERVQEWCARQKTPSNMTKARIEEATDGAVSFADWSTPQLRRWARMVLEKKCKPRSRRQTLYSLNGESLETITMVKREIEVETAKRLLGLPNRGTAYYMKLQEKHHAAMTYYFAKHSGARDEKSVREGELERDGIRYVESERTMIVTQPAFSLLLRRLFYMRRSGADPRASIVPSKRSYSPCRGCVSKGSKGSTLTRSARLALSRYSK